MRECFTDGKYIYFSELKFHLIIKYKFLSINNLFSGYSKTVVCASSLCYYLRVHIVVEYIVEK